MSKPIDIETVEQWKTTLYEAKEKNQLVVVDFFATWCGPCKVIAPKYELLAKEHPEIVFLKVNVDELPSIAEENKIRAMPTFLVIGVSGEKDSVVGANLQELARVIEKHQAASASTEPEKTQEVGDAGSSGDATEEEDEKANAVPLEPSGEEQKTEHEIPDVAADGEKKGCQNCQCKSKVDS